MDMWYSLQVLNKPELDGEMHAIVSVEANSRWFAGHFPGSPILPGIAQLDMVTELITLSEQKSFSVRYFSRVKFKKIISPGESLALRVLPAETPGLYSFRITHQDQDVCSGMISIEDTLTETPS